MPWFTRIAITSLTALVAGPALAHLEILPAIAGFAIFMASLPLGIVALLWAGIAFMRRTVTMRQALSATVALPAVLILAIIATRILAADHPRINDVSTDLVDPPALINGAAYPERFVDIVRTEYPDVQPLDTHATAGEVRRQVVAIVERQGWQFEPPATGDSHVRGVATSSLFRFRDDWAIRWRAHNNGIRIDMRSRSRDGRGDLGVNATRIAAFIDELQQRLAATSDNKPR